jgi:hypothetical protein
MHENIGEDHIKKYVGLMIVEEDDIPLSEVKKFFRMPR